MEINGVLKGGLLENRADIGDTEAKKIGRITCGANIASPYGGVQVSPLYIGRGDFISRSADINELANVRSTLMNEDARLQQSIEVLSGAIGQYSIVYSLGEDIANNLQITGTASKNHAFPNLTYLFPVATTRTISYSAELSTLGLALPVGNKYEISAETYVSIGPSATTTEHWSPIFIRFPITEVSVGPEDTFSSTLAGINGFHGKSSQGSLGYGGRQKRRAVVGLSNGVDLYTFEMREYDLDASTYTVVSSSATASARLSFSLQTMDPNVLVAFGSGLSMNLIFTRVQ